MRPSLLLHSPAVLLCLALVLPAAGKPYSNGRFQGRLAYSADGNHNDPDDWIASPLTLAILAEAGLKDRLVHFHYNSILPLTDPEWEKIHADSVLGAVERYGFDRTVFFNCRQDLADTLAHLTKAINDSSADNPLYFIIAGPMDVTVRAIRNSDPAKRQHVYCISHSAWNDGYGANYKYPFTKRSVIEQDVHWVQIRDQNAKLSFGKYGRPSTPDEFAPYFWMRDSADPKMRFLWERMIVSTRPDPSDAGMTWFLVTGDEECDPTKLKRLLQDHQLPSPISARARVRLEAENFRELKDCVVESRNDRAASHRLNARVAQGKLAASLGTRFDEPFTRQIGRYDLEVRYFDGTNAPARFAVLVNGEPQGPAWQTSGAGKGWSTKLIPDVALPTGHEIRIEMEGAGARVDYVQLNARPNQTAPSKPSKPIVYAWFPARFGSWNTDGIDWNGLTHICFRSVEITGEGKLRRIAGNPPREFVDTAHRHGVKVTVLAWARSRADSDSYLAKFPEETARNLLAYVQENNLDGVNIDDEQMGPTNAVAKAANRDLVTRFFRILATTFRAADNNYHISFAAPPVITATDRFGSSWLDVKAIAEVVDGIIPMGYTQNPPSIGWTTNPEPLGGGGHAAWTTARDIETMVRDYLQAMGGQKEKLLVGVSLRPGGYEWRCRTDQPMSPTLDKGAWRSLAECEVKMRTHGARWDDAQKSPWYCYRDGDAFVQGWFNDARAWKAKLDWINARGLGGIGIWVLDGAKDPPETWQALREFSGCHQRPDSNSATPGK